MRPQRQNPPERKGCYNCGIEDHWQRECHFEKQPQLKPVQIFCNGCMVMHFSIQCPKNPLYMAQTSQDAKKTPSNVIQVIPLGIEDCATQRMESHKSCYMQKMGLGDVRVVS